MRNEIDFIKTNNKFINFKRPDRDFQFHSHDGRKYPTSEAQIRADEAYFRETHRFIVFDAEGGRREIPPGTGPIKVCVGHLIEMDPVTWKKRYVPLYKIETF